MTTTPAPDDNLALDLLKGAAAGALAVWAMDRLGWWLWDREDPATLARERAARPTGLDPAHVAANRVAAMLGRPLEPRQPHPAGVGVHYAIGMGPAMGYAALRHRVPALRAGRGLAYGLGLFLAVDEGVVPALGLAAGPTAYPWQAHARGLASHLVLGLVTDVALDLLDRALDGRGSDQRASGGRDVGGRADGDLVPPEYSTPEAEHPGYARMATAAGNGA